MASYIDSKDYLPLRPVLTDENESLVAERLALRLNKLKEKSRTSKSSHLSRYLATKTSDEEIIDDIDDLEEVIGDDAFGAFLNGDGEIQVGTKIYKYTDVGLFIIDEEKYFQLESYLASKNISNNLLVPTDEVIKSDFIQNRACHQYLMPVDGGGSDAKIEYFNAYRCGGNDSPPMGGSYNLSNGNPKQNQAHDYVNGLQNCSPKKGLFGEIFGSNSVCIDRYETRYRVKTKAYNYNYYLVYHLGVKVKHQYRGWTRIWRKENADEIRLGVISSTFFYDYSSNIQYSGGQKNITTIYNNNNRLMFDATVNWSQNGLQITGFSTQGFPRILQDDIVIEQFSNNQLINQAIQAGNNQLTAHRLNHHFWGAIISNLGRWWKNMGKTEPDPNNITYVYKAPEIGKILVEKTLYKHSQNASKLEKTFDWGFQIGFKLGGDGNISPDLSGGALVKPSDFKVNLYGIAKRNGVWHGSKMNTN